MKVLYLVPKINSEGGLERILSLKANYLMEHYHHEITILTQNKGNHNLFYPLHDSIKLYDIDLSGNRFQFIFKYLKGLKKVISEINPDVIIVADSMYKTFLIHLVAGNKRIIYECHNSVYVRLSPDSRLFFLKWVPKFLVWFNRYMAKKMDVFVGLSDQTIQEWNIQKNGKVIPNPNWLKTTKKADLDSKKILIIARHSYEKGLDRFFNIWKEIAYKYPDWQVEIIGKEVENSEYKKEVIAMGISDSIIFTPPTKQIEAKYFEASIYAMTSRFEAFPMVLIEAMSCGIPVIAYDCPCGPRAIISNNENGFLIENNNQEQFATHLENLIENSELRKKMGDKAKESVQDYDIETIMVKWNDLLTN